MSRRRAALLLIPLLVGWPGRTRADETPGPSDAPYDDQYIGFDDFGGVVSHDGFVTGMVQWSVPYVGKYKQPLVGADSIERSDGMTSRGSTTIAWRSRPGWSRAD